MENETVPQQRGKADHGDPYIHLRRLAWLSAYLLSVSSPIKLDSFDLQKRILSHVSSIYMPKVLLNQVTPFQIGASKGR